MLICNLVGQEPTPHGIWAANSYLLSEQDGLRYGQMQDAIGYAISNYCTQYSSIYSAYGLGTRTVMTILSARMLRIGRLNLRVLLGAAASVVVVAVTFSPTACAKDGASYKAGVATGVGWAQDTLAVAGVGGVPDAEILGTCPGLAKSAENTQMYYYYYYYYYYGGQIPGASITHADFVNGCIDGARSVIG